MNTRLTANLHSLPLIDENGKVSDLKLMDVLSGKAGTLKSLGLVFVTESIKQTETKQTTKLNGSKAASNHPPAIPYMMDTKTKESLTGVKPVKKGSKVDTMLKMLLRKNGATFDQIKEKFGWTSGAVGSYLYYYPKELGYELKKEIQNGVAIYKTSLPNGLNSIAYA